MVVNQTSLDSYNEIDLSNFDSKFGKYGEKLVYGSFWTSKQRNGNSIHEVSYRACFKPQLPDFFLYRYSKAGDMVLDPFGGRGTTAIESALLGRIPISNDINPISKILTEHRLTPPTMSEIQERLSIITFDKLEKSDLDLSMFYESGTEGEIVSLRNYLTIRREEGKEDNIDKWIRMISTNRLSGHSRGFFSVYTLPPNQATTQEEQKRINGRLNQKPEYRNVKEIISKKSKSLLKDITPEIRKRLFAISKNAIFLEDDSRHITEVKDNSVDITIT
jgi:hypothetical protein